jgi:O-antigen/teichoic acid export membrane protein
MTYLVPLLASSLTPLVTLRLITAELSPERYGAWVLAVVFGSFVTGIANLGLPTGFERNFFEHKDAASRAALLYGVVGLVGGLCLAGGLVTWHWREALSLWWLGHEGDGWLMVTAYAGTAVTLVKQYFLLSLRNVDDARSFAWYSVDETLLGSALSVGLVLWGGFGALGLALGQMVAASVVFVAVAWRFLRRDLPWRASSAAMVLPLVRAALRISLPLTPRIFVGVLSNNWDKYILGQLTSLGVVGMYGVAQRLAYGAFQIMTAIEHMFVPEVYRRMFAGGDAAASIGRYLTPFAYASAGAALAVALGASMLVGWVAAPEYSAAAPLTGILAAAYGLMFFGKVPQLAFAKRTAWAAALTAVTLLVNVLTSLMLVPRLGAVGAALSSALAVAIGAGVGHILRQRAYPISWDRSVAWILAMMASGSATAVALDVWWPSTSWAWGIKIVVGGMFLLLGLTLGYHRLDYLKALVAPMSPEEARPA